MQLPCDATPSRDIGVHLRALHGLLGGNDVRRRPCAWTDSLHASLQALESGRGVRSSPLDMDPPSFSRIAPKSHGRCAENQKRSRPTLEPIGCTAGLTYLYRLSHLSFCHRGAHFFPCRPTSKACTALEAYLASTAGCLFPPAFHLYAVRLVQFGAPLHQR